MCGSLLSKFKETTDKVDHAKTVSPDPLKLIDKFSLKDDCPGKTEIEMVNQVLNRWPKFPEKR